VREADEEREVDPADRPFSRSGRCRMREPRKEEQKPVRLTSRPTSMFERIREYKPSIREVRGGDRGKGEGGEDPRRI